MIIIRPIGYCMLAIAAALFMLADSLLSWEEQQPRRSNFFNNIKIPKLMRSNEKLQERHLDQAKSRVVHLKRKIEEKQNEIQELKAKLDKAQEQNRDLVRELANANEYVEDLQQAAVDEEE